MQAFRVCSEDVVHRRDEQWYVVIDRDSFHQNMSAGKPVKQRLPAQIFQGSGPL